MNQEIIEELRAISKHGEQGRHFYIRNETKDIVKLDFKGYVDGDILYKIMKIAHIDGFSHRGGKTTMEIEEKWDTQTDI